VRRGAVPQCSLGHDLEPPVLPEVLVEGRRSPDPQALHDDEADRVAQRVGLVLVSTDELDGPAVIFARHVDDPREAGVNLIEEPAGELSRGRSPVDSQQERMRLVNHGRRRQEIRVASAPVQEVSGLVTMLVVVGEASVEHARIDEDHSLLLGGVEK
jgi:hypothetical protein